MRIQLVRVARAAVLGVALAGFCAPAFSNTAIEPVAKDARWMSRHEGFVTIARRGHVDVLFLGDSITDFWQTTGKDVWAREYGALRAANFGISADRTQNVLWRIEHGELDGIRPKVVVLLIGTNNTGFERGTTPPTPRNTPAEAVEGVTAVAHAIRAKLPETKILLLAIFPRADVVAPPPEHIREINAAIARLADGKQIRFLDISPKLLGADGTLSKDLMPDLLHPSAKGYEIWAAEMKAPLAEMLK